MEHPCMKARNQILAAGLLTCATLSAPGQETPLKAVPDSPSKPASAVEAVEPPVDAAVSPGPIVLTQPLIDARMLDELVASTNAAVIQLQPVREDQVDFQKVRVEGGVAPVVKRPTFVRFLQLFNPFAPAEYGGMAGAGGQGATLSRAFHDPAKSQPTSPLISVGNKPDKSKPSNDDEE